MNRQARRTDPEGPRRSISGLYNIPEIHFLNKDLPCSNGAARLRHIAD
jgi:hypothetical protein